MKMSTTVPGARQHGRECYRRWARKHAGAAMRDHPPTINPYRDSRGTLAQAWRDGWLLEQASAHYRIRMQTEAMLEHPRAAARLFRDLCAIDDSRKGVEA